MNGQDQLKQLEGQLALLADEMAALRKRIEDEAKAAKYVGILPVIDGGRYTVDKCGDYLYSGNSKQRDAFTEAFAVMWELRKQPGIVVPTGRVNVHMVMPTLLSSGRAGVDVDNYSSFSSCFSPAYETRDAAQAALDAVGRDRIAAAFRTLLFMTPESHGEA